MRTGVITFAVAIMVQIASSAQAGNFAVRGNDTGGIIAWSPAVAEVYREVADEHCAIYKKIAHITSMRHDYGEFIGFKCINSKFDPSERSELLSRPDRD
jgi:hypothetical protein